MVNECLPYDAVCSKMHFVSFCCAHMFLSEILTGCTRFGGNSIFCVNTRCVSAHVFDSDYNYGHIDVCLFEKNICACMTCRQIYILQAILQQILILTCLYGKYACTCMCVCVQHIHICLYGFVWQICIRVFAIANTSVGNATFCADCRAGFAAHGIVIPNCIVKALRQFCSMYMNVYINVYIYECKLIHRFNYIETNTHK